MEYLIKGISEENKVIFTRITEIPKSENGLVNVINESERERIVDISDVISCCFSNSTDHKTKGHIIKDIIIAQDSDTVAFKVIYNDFFYYKDNGELSCKIGEDIYYVQGNDDYTTHIKEILLNRVKEFIEKEKEINELHVQDRMAEAERLKEVKKEVIAVLIAALKDKEQTKPNISLAQFRSFVDSNKKYVDKYIKSHWKYSVPVYTVSTLTSVISMFVGYGLSCYYEDMGVAIVSAAFSLVPLIIMVKIDEIVSKETLIKAEKSFTDAGSEEITKLKTENEGITKVL